MRLNYFLAAVLFFCFFTAQNSNAESKKVRYPAVAGAFYPYDQEKLSGMIDGFLSKATKVDIKGKIVGVVAPHAGYEYSGPVAAYAFKELEGKSYDTVIILGVNHRVYGFNDVSVYKEGSFKTPLGFVEIDSDLAGKIIKEDPEKFLDSPDTQAEEHSIEVEIPFLQKALKGGFKIVPIMIGDYSTPVLEKLANAITKNIAGKNVLIVASTDLSHDKDYDTACGMDKMAVDNAAGLDIDKTVRQEAEGKTEMCGYGPVVTLMFIAKAEGVKEGHVLKYANSGDTTGDKYGRIVGYGAVIFAKE